VQKFIYILQKLDFKKNKWQKKYKKNSVDISIDIELKKKKNEVGNFFHHRDLKSQKSTGNRGTVL